MRRRLLAVFMCILCFVVIIASREVPHSKEMPMATYITNNAYAETGASNAVTATYLFYRYYDTLFEALMLLFSIIAVIYMSIHEGDKYDE